MAGKMASMSTGFYRNELCEQLGDQVATAPVRLREATKAEKVGRVNLAIELLLAGRRTGEIKQVFWERFGPRHVQTLRYICSLGGCARRR